jgi:hypothetical protein
MEPTLSLTLIETKSESYDKFPLMASLIQPIPMRNGNPQLPTPKPSPEKSDHENNADEEVAEAEDVSDTESVDLDAQSPTALECVEQLQAFIKDEQRSLEELQETFKKAADKGTCLHLGWYPADTRIARQLVLEPLDITKSNRLDPKKRVRAVHVPAYKEMKFDAPAQVPSPMGGKMLDSNKPPIEGKALLLGRVKSHYRCSHENYGGDFEEGYIMAVLPGEDNRLVILREDGEGPIDGESEDEVVTEVTWRNLWEMQKFPGNKLLFGETEFSSWNTL